LIFDNLVAISQFDLSFFQLEAVIVVRLSHDHGDEWNDKTLIGY